MGASIYQAKDLGKLLQLVNRFLFEGSFELRHWGRQCSESEALLSQMSTIMCNGCGTCTMIENRHFHCVKRAAVRPRLLPQAWPGENKRRM
eukprot:gene11456-17622_t